MLDMQTLLVIIGMLCSAVAALVSLFNRAAIAELETKLLKDQERRCKECEERFIGRREYEAAAAANPRPLQIARSRAE